ncbi:unannotated protein [freshwater metagenome]|uniref:UDP-N-acetylmuramate dehydrogenase n=1 Tax=freshwater metagenome TaxID=449393 RepID=A0A6J7DGY4_9ZZZZ
MSGPREGVPLAPLTTLRLGGPARRFVTATTAEELADAVLGAAEPLLLLAGGSNLVIADEGLEGTVVHVASRGVAFEDLPDGRVRVRVQAGEPWDGLVEQLVAEGLSGAEALSGIPGSAGATPIQNVGAYGCEVAELLHAVRVLDRASGVVEELPAAACGLGYRTSRFKGSDRFVILEAAYELARDASSAPIRYAELAAALGVEPGACAPAAEVRRAVIELRARKGMVLKAEDHDTWSAGSFFTNPIVPENVAERIRTGLPPEHPALPAWPAPGGVKLSAAWLIEAAGTQRGDAEGGIAVSTRHALALTNRGSGTTAELLRLAHRMADRVDAAFGVELVPEPVFAGVSWTS